MNSFDFLVVGASMSGALAARAAAENGARVAILEDHARPGKFGKCSGLVAKKSLDALGAGYSGAALNDIRGARLFSPNASLRVESSQTQAVAMNRQALDEACVAQAQRAGAELFLGHRVDALEQTGEGVRAKTARGVFDAAFLAACDGVASPCAKAAGFPELRPSDFVLCYEAEYENARVENPRLVDVFLDARKFPGFFAWSIPINEETVRVGVGTFPFNALNAARNHVLQLPQVSEALGLENGGMRARNVRAFHHVIPLRTRARTQIGRVALAGDAAGQVKATTGGGIALGGRCAQLAGETAASAALDKKAWNYERVWKRELGAAFALHRAARAFLNSLPNTLLDAWLASLKFLGAEKLLANHGDMDYFFTPLRARS